MQKGARAGRSGLPPGVYASLTSSALGSCLVAWQEGTRHCPPWTPVWGPLRWYDTGGCSWLSIEFEAWGIRWSRTAGGVTLFLVGRSHEALLAKPAHGWGGVRQSMHRGLGRGSCASRGGRTRPMSGASQALRPWCPGILRSGGTPPGAGGNLCCTVRRAATPPPVRPHHETPGIYSVAISAGPAIVRGDSAEWKIDRGLRHGVAPAPNP